MNYDERMTKIRSELVGMMTTYIVPKHLDDDRKVAMEIEGIAKMINSKFPNDTTEDHIRGTFERASMKLKEAHKSRNWPNGAEISTAIAKSMNASQSSLPKAFGWKPDSLEVNAKRIKAGEPVGEMYIQGKMAERMVRDGLVTEEELAPYLVYLDAHKRLTQPYE